ncbi:hypothetical protein CLOHYLEM_07604 [[Clostridium] hylemonae DSM 15053]|uniref:Uncharacterized protein n=1 Tax=[Clostridium] hylemonae DSM 15053 TaxID=553973 RepID=C0C667_9FIRM|nr:hypothetical protein CLOHYLEM_07604 [[Clostridium] hylemonae DSM 15053]
MPNGCGCFGDTLHSSRIRVVFVRTAWQPVLFSGSKDIFLAGAGYISYKCMWDLG